MIKSYTFKENLNYQKAIELKNFLIEKLLEPNLITYNILLDLTIKADKVDQLNQLLEEMKLIGMKFDKYTFSILFNLMK